MAATKNPPGPQGNLVFGSAIDFGKNPLGFMQNAVRTYGDFVFYRLMNRPAYLINDPALLHRVLVTEADKYDKPQMAKQLLKRLLGNGLVTSDGEFWRRQRKLAQPAFHSRRVAGYAEMMVNNTLTM